MDGMINLFLIKQCVPQLNLQSLNFQLLEFFAWLLIKELEFKPIES